MVIVIVGAKDRTGPQEQADVNQLIELCAAAYPGCLFVTMLTQDESVGKFVREKCAERDSRGNYRFKLVEANLRVYASNLSKSEVSQIYISRNATVFELGNVFYYFAGNSRRGTMEDLVQRVEKAGMPLKIFLSGDPVKLLDLGATDTGT